MAALKNCPHTGGSKGKHTHRTRKAFLACHRANGPKGTWKA
jgi:hypothetical protein